MRGCAEGVTPTRSAELSGPTLGVAHLYVRAETFTMSAACSRRVTRPRLRTASRLPWPAVSGSLSKPGRDRLR